MVEIMVVLAILGSLLAVGLPRIKKNQNNVKKVARELTVLGREIRNQSRLKNMTHRLALQMGKNSAYWVEYAQGPVVAKISLGSSAKEKSDDKDKAENEFQKSPKFFKGKDKPLPDGLFIVSVETQTLGEAQTDGLAYVYFSPEGLVEKSVIQIGNGKNLTWSLLYNPITGHADIAEKAVSLKDAQAE